jgi:hypothetical protein
MDFGDLMGDNMPIKRIDVANIQVGDQVCWMPQRPIQDHGISRSILEFGFITGPAVPSGVPVRLWKHDEYHHYDSLPRYADSDRMLSPSDLYKWTAVIQEYVADCLEAIKGE